jgi:hypothetical protein
MSRLFTSTHPGLVADHAIPYLLRFQVRWITFHSSYDFGYMLKVLTCQPLPATETEFFEMLKVNCRFCLPVSLTP